jgi:hypothetical protein
MAKQHPHPVKDKRAKRYSDEQLHEFELAGGMEGGMPAGRAGGPGEKAEKKVSTPDKPKGE